MFKDSSVQIWTAHCLSATISIQHCLIMCTLDHIVISYHHHSLIFKQSLMVIAQPLTPLAVGHWIWLQDVDKCLEDVTSIITGASKLEKGWIIYQLYLPSISTTIAVPCIWSSPPPPSLFIYNIFYGSLKDTLLFQYGTIPLPPPLKSVQTLNLKDGKPFDVMDLLWAVY